MAGLQRAVPEGADGAFGPKATAAVKALPAQSRAGAGRCGRLLDPDRDKEQDAALMPVPVGIGKGVGNVLR